MHEIVAADFDHHDVVQVQLTSRCVNRKDDQKNNGYKIDPE